MRYRITEHTQNGKTYYKVQRQLTLFGLIFWIPCFRGVCNYDGYAYTTWFEHYHETLEYIDELKKKREAKKLNSSKIVGYIEY